jgi:hypothetical protein
MIGQLPGYETVPAKFALLLPSSNTSPGGIAPPPLITAPDEIMLQSYGKTLSGGAPAMLTVCTPGVENLSTFSSTTCELYLANLFCSLPTHQGSMWFRSSTGRPGRNYHGDETMPLDSEHWCC